MAVSLGRSRLPRALMRTVRTAFAGSKSDEVDATFSSTSALHVAFSTYRGSGSCMRTDTRRGRLQLFSSSICDHSSTRKSCLAQIGQPCKGRVAKPQCATHGNKSAAAVTTKQPMRRAPTHLHCHKLHASMRHIIAYDYCDVDFLVVVRIALADQGCGKG